MPMSARIALLLAAALCGGFVAFQGASFSNAVEPESYTAATAGFWFAAGAVISAPLWLPALVPSRFSVTLKLCRWVGATVLLLPTYLFSTIVIHNISRSVSGLGATPHALIQGAVLTVACICGIVILLWPELSAHAKHAT